MKLLLIQPPSPSLSEAIPLGLGYLASVIKQEGHEVKIIDGTAAYAKYTAGDIIKFMREHKPDAIGMTLMTTHVWRAYKLAEEIKKANKNTPLIAGWPHATILPEEPLKHGFDIAFIGEAEETIRDYLKNKPLNKINGICCKDKKQNKIFHTKPRQPIENLDEIPLPSRESFNLADFQRSEKELKNVMSTIMTSRGCIGKCIFCSKSVSGQKYRFRSAENIIKEVKEIRSRYKVGNFYFIDDTINVNHRRLKEICAYMKKIILFGDAMDVWT